MILLNWLHLTPVGIRNCEWMARTPRVLSSELSHHEDNECLKLTYPVMASHSITKKLPLNVYILNSISQYRYKNTLYLLLDWVFPSHSNWQPSSSHCWHSSSLTCPWSQAGIKNVFFLSSSMPPLSQTHFMSLCLLTVEGLSWRIMSLMVMWPLEGIWLINNSCKQ